MDVGGFVAWHPVLGGLLVVGGAVALAILAAEAVRRYVNRDVLLAHNELAGFILAVVGVVYAVLLGFVAIGVWERFDQAEVRTYSEAGQLATIYRDADAFPAGPHLRDQLRSYIETVVNGEWPLMQHGRESALADRQIERIDATVRHLPVRNGLQQNAQAQMLASAEAALADRDQRIFMDASGLNPVMWWTLTLGGVVTIGFALLFGFSSALMQRLMIAALAAIIGLVLYLTLSLDFPYRGVVSVKSEAFSQVLETFARIDAERSEMPVPPRARSPYGMPAKMPRPPATLSPGR